MFNNHCKISFFIIITNFCNIKEPFLLENGTNITLLKIIFNCQGGIIIPPWVSNGNCFPLPTQDDL